MILSRPTTITKGVPTTFTLNKAELASHPGITDSFYADADAWKKVTVVYKSSTGNQKRVVAFRDLSIASPVGEFKTSPRARNIFLISTIILWDKDGSSHSIQRESLSAEEKTALDILLS